MRVDKQPIARIIVAAYLDCIDANVGFENASGKAGDPNKVYLVATNNYVAASGEYPSLSEVPLLKGYGICEQALLDCIMKNAQ